jgi:large subunit ribosomal protein L20
MKNNSFLNPYKLKKSKALNIFLESLWNKLSKASKQKNKIEYKMTRVKRGNVSRKRHKKILKLNKGFRGSASTLFRTANQQSMKALRYSYRNRRQKKRDFRSIWIARLNAAVRRYGLNYSEFMHYLQVKKIQLNRKILAQLSICDSEAFTQLLLF